MTQITEEYIDSLAPNAGAIKNGNDLVRKNNFQLLCRTVDHTLLFGECKGSGKVPYSCSVDFIKAEQPVFRCSCPSRQFPCKHTLGLMYAYATGKAFTVEEIPADIADKREKADKRDEKKRETAETPAGTESKRKVNKNALAKKFAAQLEGVELARKLVQQMVQSGLASLDNRSIRMFEDQAKQLGNYYVPGIQTDMRKLLFLIGSSENNEAIYSQIVEHLAAFHVLLKRSREHLKARIEGSSMDITSILEEKIGHAWQLSELREYGLIRQDVELVQLSFHSYSDDARGEYVDEGYWMQLHDGEIVVTRNYRPFRAAKHMKEEDSIYLVVQTKELFAYPGDMNKRVRWEEMMMRELDERDRMTVRSFAERSFTTAIKNVKNQLKNPLADKNPIILLLAEQIAKSEQEYVLVDDQGVRMPLASISTIGHPTTELFSYLNEKLFSHVAVLVMFENDLSAGKLVAQPLALITEQEMIRLFY
ncbi:SWIM zinc finger family protein [Paenibacillus sp. L3-i20]|uniref:SWIM zinc finger family protein n=1 Tax=Paenibacillus sp. L3-i20 TaxID=2905833 RepID=UPI001EDE17DB|nr:SWIM zinc finger family protein [Paenibacillus sp. L3-i20]GKU78292.1 hypothetical protein L3i20_v226890 [Paenibacillus sp. L3-i20]